MEHEHKYEILICRGHGANRSADPGGFRCRAMIYVPQLDNRFYFESLQQQRYQCQNLVRRRSRHSNGVTLRTILCFEREDRQSVAESYFCGEHIQRCILCFRAHQETVSCWKTVARSYQTFCFRFVSTAQRDCRCVLLPDPIPRLAGLQGRIVKFAAPRLG